MTLSFRRAIERIIYWSMFCWLQWFAIMSNHSFLSSSSRFILFSSSKHLWFESLWNNNETIDRFIIVILRLLFLRRHCLWFFLRSNRSTYWSCISREREFRLVFVFLSFSKKNLIWCLIVSNCCKNRASFDRFVDFLLYRVGDSLLMIHSWKMCVQVECASSIV